MAIVNQNTSQPRNKRTNIYKPNSNHGPAILYQNGSPITIRDPNGNVLDTLTGGIRGAEGTKHPINPNKYPSGSTWEAEGNSHVLPAPGQRAEYPIYSDLQNNSKNPGNTASGTGDGPYSGNVKPAGGGGGFGGGGATGFAANPYYVGPYPDFPTIDYKPIESAPYNFTNAQDFAGKYGDFNRGQIAQNFKQSQEFGLQTVDTELQGLKAFAPQAAALSRDQIGQDNTFNQDQRTTQVDNALPGVRNTLNQQADRASAYASGRLPDSIMDRALELGIRSRSADQSSFSGFGSKSGQASKLSDLQSAETRFGIAQFGEQLTSTNINQKAAIQLAPTQYSTAGSQIRAVPEVGAGRAATAAFGAINESTLLSPGQAFQSEIQQNQFQTGQEQNTRQFNASNTLNTDQFNANGVWSSRVGQFNYDAAYASQLQAASQINLNGAIALQQQGIQAQTGQAGTTNAQNSGTISSGIQTIGQIAGIGQGTAPATNITGGNANAGTQSVNTGGSSGPAGGQAVGGTQVDTSSSTAGSGTQGNAQPTTVTGSSTDGTVPQSNTKALSVEPSSPGGVRYSADSPPPAGYVQAGPASNGTAPAAPISNYAQDLERFAKYSGNPSNSIATVQNMATVDNQISQAAQIQYLPSQGFQPIGLSPSGRSLHSTPSAIGNNQADLGQQVGASTGSELASLGILDPSVHAALGEHISGMENIDTTSDVAPTEQIKGLLEGIDTSTDAGQQLAYGLMRTEDMWDKMSPGQRSNALGSLADQRIEAKTGKNFKTLAVPGTDGTMSVKDAIELKKNGGNPQAYARAYSDTRVAAEALGADTSKMSAQDLYNFAGQAGFIGHGPQNASVPVDAEVLKDAHPAPEMGVGAMVFNDANAIPRSYKVLQDMGNGQVLAVPENLLGTSSASKEHIAKMIKRAGEGSTPKSQQLWKKVDSGVIRGSAGGDATVSGVMSLMKNNPQVASAMIAHSMFNNTHGD